MRPFLQISLISLLLLLLASSCKKDEALPSCEGTMFGLPAGNTGLDESFCKPSCACKDFNSKTFSAAEIAALKSWELNTVIPELTTSPYGLPVPEGETKLCAIKIEDLAARIYSIGDYPDEATARAAGAIVTHHDGCGLCSTLPDFAVYAN